MIDDMIGMQPNLPLDVTEDLATVAPGVSRLAVAGSSRNLDRLASLTSLEVLWVADVSPPQFEKIVSLVDPLYLRLSGFRVADLAPLGRLQRLQALELHWNTRLIDISFLRALPGLRLLTISDCPKVRDLSPLAGMRDLEILHLSGGMWNTFKPETLAPLAGLTRLRGLSLINIRVGDQSLAPLEGLDQLERLDISNQFPTEEYARLSVVLTQTQCDRFAPYVEFPDWEFGPSVLVTGKGKPLLKVPQEQARLDTYVERFRALQEGFRTAKA